MKSNNFDRRTLRAFLLFFALARIGSWIESTCRKERMINQDFLTVAVLLFAVLAALLVPPGPGTPLKFPVKQN